MRPCALITRIIGMAFLCTLLCAAPSSAQTLVQTPVTATINSTIGGYLEALPSDYATNTSKSYPLMVFIHGTGEIGSGSQADLPKVWVNGPPKLIHNGTFPSSFTVGGKSYQFIVISPQYNGNDRNVATMESLMAYILKKYRVDTTRIYVTGLSMGGGIVEIYAGTSADAKKIAAVAPVAGNTPAYDGLVKIVGAASTPCWFFHNLNDPTVPSSYTSDWYTKLSAYSPAMVPQPKATIFDASGHDSWSKAYDPSYTENGLNVFQWMLSYTRGGTTTTTNSAPVANAGTDKAITLPTTSIALSGSGTDADGTIKTYAWSYVSGPTTYSFSSTSVAAPTVSGLTTAGTYVFKLTVTDDDGATGTDNVNVVVSAAANVAPVASAGTDKAITLPTTSVALSGSGTDADGTIKTYAWSEVSGPTTASFSSTSVAAPTVSNLTTAGTYVFRLTVTDNSGATATDDINVVVSSASSGSVGGTGSTTTVVQAESYSSMSGVATQTTTDSLGGLNVGWIDAADWMAYTVKIDTAGTYLFSFRVACPYSGRTFAIMNAAGATLATVALPLTGSFSIYKTVTASVTLPAGTQALTIYTANGGWNFNWFSYVRTSVSTPTTTTTTKLINVNIYAGSNGYNNAAWNDWNIGAGAKTSMSSGAFKYADATTSTVAALLSQSTAVVDNGTAYGSGMAPAEVLRYTSYGTASRTLTLSGLSTSKKYNLSFYAGRNSNSGNSTTFTVNGSAVTVATYNNTTNAASFSGISPSSSGTIVITIGNVTTYNYLNGFSITETTTTTTSAASEEVTATAETLSADVSAATTDASQGFTVYPNPVQTELTLQINNERTGTMKVQVYDIKGSLQKEYSLVKDQTFFSQKLYLSNLTPGVYILNVQIGSYRHSMKIIKL